MKSVVNHIACPSCGDTLGLKGGERISKCPSCGSKSIVEIKDHIPQYAFEPTFDVKAAKAMAKRLLADAKLALDLKKEARFYDAGLYYLPFYELTAQRTGKFILTKYKKINFVDVAEENANVLMRDLHYQAPAVKLGDWGVEEIKIEKMRQLKPLKPFDNAKIEKQAHVFDSTIPPENSDLNKLTAATPGDETRLLRQNLRIIYCPVWLIKYSYRKRLYRIVIDAVGGNVLFARAPALDAERIPIMIAALGITTYPIARGIRTIFEVSQNISQASTAMIFVSVITFPILTFFVFLAAMAWNQFRYSGEVVWRGETMTVERVNKPPETAMEKVARLMASALEEYVGNIKIAPAKTNRWYGPWQL